MKKNILLIIIIILVVIIISATAWYVNQENHLKNQETSSSSSLVANANYACNNEKTIKAEFYKGKEKAVKPGEMPIPTGSVKVNLSDGRNFDLAQTISADGSRYANGDESFVFWSKGNGVLVLENNQEKDYIDCVIVAPDIGGLPNVYHNGIDGFTIRYPKDYIVNTNYKYQELGPGKDISGVKFTIPESMATGTNLSSYDTGVSVEILPNTADCNAGLFLYNNPSVLTINKEGKEYSFASSTDAGAGNFYEEEVWAITGTDPCTAVRYLIHYTNIGNYPEGVVKEYDRESLVKQFDKIRETLITL